MKKIYFLFATILLVLSVSVYAQLPPTGINYQAAARDASGNIIANQAITIQFTIISTSATGTVDYVEQQSLTTNQFGLFNTAIGSGTLVSGSFPTAAQWGASLKFLKVELDPQGGTNFIDMGTTQFMSAVK